MKDITAALLSFLCFVSLTVFLPLVYATENSWETMADMPTEKLGAGVASENGKIYVIGRIE